MSGWDPKGLMERLNAQAVHAPDDVTRAAIAHLTGILSLHRPVGTNGKHDLHTPTCGCDPVDRWQPSTYRAAEALLTDLGDVLKRERREQGLSVRQVAMQSGEAASTVSRVERGKDCNLSSALGLLAWIDGGAE